MKTRKRAKTETLIALTSYQRMERWHLCQRIAKIYYEFEIPFDELLQIESYLKESGILE